MHVPWCVRKCPYCDFNSHERQSELPERAYLDALLADLDQDLHWVHGRPLEAIFIGGGTPSLMDPSVVSDVLERIRKSWRVANELEVTLEAHPGPVEAGRMSA